ncbi:uncharacterized protein LOC135333206 [Halichondria panicea]|uniref:uncharacterized protein LOC135333206 n=1 Tax=Halichondria panicea TaxID=6063 RepID=UPI00312B5E45
MKLLLLSLVVLIGAAAAMPHLTKYRETALEAIISKLLGKENEVMIQNTCPSNGYVLYWTQSLKFIFKPVCNGAMVCIDATQPLPPLCPYYYAPTLGSLGECQQLSWTVQNKITQFEICNSKLYGTCQKQSANDLRRTMTGVCDGNTQPEVVQQKPRVCEIKPDGSEDCGVAQIMDKDCFCIGGRCSGTC